MGARHDLTSEILKHPTYGDLGARNDDDILCAQVTAGTVSVGSRVMCRVDYERRANVAPNHTMTHVLNFALRKVPYSRRHDSTCDRVPAITIND